MRAAASGRAEEKRLLLLKAAFREVAEKGSCRVTLEDIARRSAVSKGVTLYYFASKEDLFRQLFLWLTDAIVARMREAVASASDPVEKIRALVAITFPSPARNRAFFRAYIDFCGLAARNDSFRQTGERFYAECREVDQGIILDGIRQGVFRVRDAGDAASTLRAIFDGLMLQWLAERDPDTAFSIYRERCELELFSYLLGPEKDRERIRRR